MARLVLIVEDNFLNMKLIHTILELEGYEILEAVSGEQALELTALMLPDLILMDIQLPGIDGLEVCHRLKLDPKTAAIPVIALTSYAMPNDEKKAIDAGCVCYITKPIDIHTFGPKIDPFFSQ